MKKHFKGFASLALSVMLAAGITACSNQLEQGSFTEVKKGRVILDNDFVTVRVVESEARAVTEQVSYTKEDWAYNTTTVTYDGVSETTEFYGKNSGINVECKKEGEYVFKSTAYKADKETSVATSDPVVKNVTFADGDFNLTITYTNIGSYEITTGVTGTVENQWGAQEERAAFLSKDWFNNENAPSRDKVKSISFIKDDYTGAFTASWSGGDNITVYYNGDDETVAVSAAGRTIYAPEDCSGFFSCFTSAETIDLSNFDTSNVTSMKKMFYIYWREQLSESEALVHFGSLTALDVSNFNTSNVTNMSYMFEGCSRLTALDLSNFDTSNVKNMAGMFRSCSRLTALDLSNFNTSKVTNMGSMFNGCSALTSLNISKFDTSNVTTMNSMFDDCESLETFEVSHFDTSNVTDMGAMFCWCFDAMVIDLSHFDTSKVTNMYGMFSHCFDLPYLNLTNFNTSNVTDMRSMFAGCTSLKSLDLNSFDTSNITSMHSMFYSCRSLTSLDVTNFDTSKVKNMDNMFYYCENLKTLDLSNFNTSNVATMEQMFDYCKNLEVTYTPATWTLGTDWSGATFVAK